MTDARGAEAVLTDGRARPTAGGVDAPTCAGSPTTSSTSSTTAQLAESGRAMQAVADRAGRGPGDRALRAGRRRVGGARGLTEPVAGRLFAGTSGFAYPGWAPRFYPAGLAADRLPGAITRHGWPRSS